jgi:hypothetical protein
MNFGIFLSRFSRPRSIRNGATCLHNIKLVCLRETMLSFRLSSLSVRIQLHKNSVSTLICIL